jgi:pyruvate/2-oxoacid:ferredoxin oxidoreductase alpha subunit
MVDMGDEELPYRTSGLTHNDTGAPAFDFETHQRMHRKRQEKLEPLRNREDLVRTAGDEECERAIITWGSSAQFVLETVRALGIQNSVKVCIPELLYPLPSRVEQFLRSTKRLLVIEMNYSGQLHRYLRSCADLQAKTSVYCRAGGRPFSINELTDAITGLLKP